jgi:3-methylfumaryl-CoA hydratase
VEHHDIVYRDLPAPGETPPPALPAPADAAWSRRVAPDDVLLFRYSALTFNGHRIHYDRRYVTEVEGYPGLVVHGPLIATLLLDLLRRELPEARVRRFAFRAVAPLFDIAPFLVCGRREDAHGVKLWAGTPEGRLAMDASATLY